MDLGVLFQRITSDSSLSKDEKELVSKISDEYRDWELSLTNEESRLIRKYTLNSHDDKKPNRFFERLNRVMRGSYDGVDKNKLIAYGHVISNAICKHPIQQQIVCYRGMDYNLMKNVAIGSTFKFDQFISTSIIEAGALKRRFKYVILVPEGVNGAYIGNLSAFQNQYEFLLDYNCEYKLIAKSGRIVYLEVVV